MAVNPVLTPPVWLALGPVWRKDRLTQIQTALATLSSAAPNVQNCDCSPTNCCQSVNPTPTNQKPICQVQCSTPCQGNQTTECQSQCTVSNQGCQSAYNQANQSQYNQLNQSARQCGQCAQCGNQWSNQCGNQSYRPQCDCCS